MKFLLIGMILGVCALPVLAMATFSTTHNAQKLAGVLGAILVVMVATGIPPRWLNEQEAQVERAQAFRKSFVVRCHEKHHGRIVHLHKASVNVVCVTSDGRWVEWY